MKITLEFTKYSEKYPEINRPILILHINQYGGPSTILQSTYKGDYKMGFEEYLYWSYFDFQPERSKREDSQECEMRCSEHCGNTVRDK